MQNMENKHWPYISKGDEEIYVLVPVEMVTDKSNFEFLNQQKNITYSKTKYNYAPDVLVHSIKFDIKEISNQFKETLINHIVQQLERAERQETKYSEVFKEIVNFFIRNRKSSKIEKLHGDIGEALFMLKCCQMGYSDQIASSYRKRDDNTFDFTFQRNDNSEHIEIKTTSKSSKEIKVSSSQNKQDTNIVVVSCDFVECETNILDIYDMLKNEYKCFPEQLAIKEFEYQNKSDEFVNSETVVLSEVNYNFFDSELIPSINWEDIRNSNALKRIIFVITTNDDYLLPFEEQIQNIFKE